MIVEFDASIDDFVDVAVRSLTDSKGVRTWHWQGLLTTALLAGLPAYILFSGTTAVRLAIAGGFGLAAAGVHLWTSRESFNARMQKLYREQLGTDGPVRVKAELTDEGVSISQRSTHTMFEWSTIKEIEESDDAIYFHTRDNHCFAVRIRGFDSTESKNQFVKLAKERTDSGQGCTTSGTPLPQGGV